MARQTGLGEFNSFTRGIITEASPLTYPERASLDEENLVLNRNGSRRRRLGVDFETGYAFTTTTAPSGLYSTGNLAVSSFLWENVGNNPAIAIAVAQIGDRLYFYDAASEPVSGSYLGTLGVVGPSPAQFTAIDGDLAVATGSGLIHLISYDEDLVAFSFKYVVPSVRDIWGVPVHTEVGERPATGALTASQLDDHKYNLFNQGWFAEVDCVTPVGTNPENVYTNYVTRASKLPALSDVWWESKHIRDPNFIDWFDYVRLDTVPGTTSRAARGHYIISPLLRSSSRASVSGITPSTDDITIGGYSAIASFAGRLFYSGIKVTSEDVEQDETPNMSCAILFSQVSDGKDSFGNCYSQADPTEEDTAGVVDSDGGILFIPEASNIHKLVPLSYALLVFADNGVWAIRGSDQGFSANNYQVDKITDVGSYGAKSVVVAESIVFYFSRSGIQVIQLNENGRLVASNITEESIQSLYLDIPSVGRLNAVGDYNPNERKVTWLYNDEEGYQGDVFKFRYNKELIFDITLQAFTKYSFPSTTSHPAIIGYQSIPNYISSVVSSPVTVGGDPVEANGDPVVITSIERARSSRTSKYMVIDLESTYARLTFGGFYNESYLDWYTFNSTGVDSGAFIETGYNLLGDTQRGKQIKYLTVHSGRTESSYTLDGSGNIVFDNPGSCLVQIKWDFSDSSNSGRWSDQFQAYRLKRLYIPASSGDPFDYGFNVVTTKNKVRGKGKAIRIRFESEAGKDFFLLGWGMVFSVKGDV